MEARELYRQRLMSAEQVVAPIKSGQRVFVGSGGAEPQTLVEALTARADRLADRDESTRIAEVAFTVRDDWQEKGIGTLLMRKLIEVGKAKGLAGSRPMCRPTIRA